MAAILYETAIHFFGGACGKMSDCFLGRVVDGGSVSAAFAQRRPGTLVQAEVSQIARVHRSRTLTRRQCLVATYVLPVVCSFFLFAPAHSQADPECLSAASLWLPTDSSRLKVVAKWNKNKEIQFGIISRENNSPTVK
jgi:hypothetical protein